MGHVWTHKARPSGFSLQNPSPSRLLTLTWSPAVSATVLSLACKLCNLSAYGVHVHRTPITERHKARTTCWIQGRGDVDQRWPRCRRKGSMGVLKLFVHGRHTPPRLTPLHGGFPVYVCRAGVGSCEKALIVAGDTEGTTAILCHYCCRAMLR